MKHEYERSTRFQIARHVQDEGPLTAAYGAGIDCEASGRYGPSWRCGGNKVDWRKRGKHSGCGEDTRQFRRSHRYSLNENGTSLYQNEERSGT
jgi:hypothetical protein